MENTETMEQGVQEEGMTADLPNWGLKIGAAVAFDGIQALIEFLMAGFGWTITWIFSLYAAMTFFTWFAKEGKHMGFIISIVGIGEVIPWIGDLPFWTGLIVVMMLREKASKGAGKQIINIASKATGGSGSLAAKALNVASKVLTKGK